MKFGIYSEGQDPKEAMILPEEIWGLVLHPTDPPTFTRARIKDDTVYLVFEEAVEIWYLGDQVQINKSYAKRPKALIEGCR